MLQRNKLQKLALIFTLLTSIGLVSCSAIPEANPQADPWGIVEIGRTDPIRIGVVTPLAYESVGGLGLDTIRGMELAIETFSSIDNRPVEIINVQGQCNAHGGTTASAAIVSDPRIAAVVGPICSSACEAAGPIYDDAHFTAISPNCGASSLIDEVQHNGSFMRTVYDDQREGEAAAQFAYRELGARVAATVSDNTADTTDAVAAFESAFQSLGGQIAVSETTPETKGYYDSILTSIEEAGTDVIYAPLQPGDAALITLQISSSPVADIALIGGRSYLTATYFHRAGIRVNTVYAVGPRFPRDEYQDLVARYVARYGEQPESPQFAFAYDAALIILRSINNVASTGSGGELIIGRQALRNSLYETNTFVGATGILTCSTWGDCSAGSLAVYESRDGVWVANYVP
jgi:branched-chain amino acid transport system substrate-binding protein